MVRLGIGPTQALCLLPIYRDLLSGRTTCWPPRGVLSAVGPSPRSVSEERLVASRAGCCHGCIPMRTHRGLQTGCSGRPSPFCRERRRVTDVESMTCVLWLCCSPQDSRAFYQSRRRAFSQAFTAPEWGLTAGSGCPANCERFLSRILCSDCSNTLPVRGSVVQAPAARGGLCVLGVEF